MQPSAVSDRREGCNGRVAAREEDGVAEYRSERDVSGPRNLERIAEVRTALANDTVDLHLQPKAAMSDGRVESCEALLRWTPSQFGRIEADRVIANSWTTASRKQSRRR